ncbi:MAG: hypothetical protein BWZ08_02102 [candidate division BRC1 bacterium ADurb.BinA292]|nr:MAG: hypothetical protein BWZ08_02102 [candidate division BRC1 bacterium ADurb.BinA292]
MATVLEERAGLREFVDQELRVGPLHGGLVQAVHQLVERLDRLLAVVGAHAIADFVLHRIARPEILLKDHRAVMQPLAGQGVDVAHLVDDAPHAPRAIEEDVAVECAREVQIVIGLERPGQRGAAGETQPGGRQVLEMAVIAPVGNKVAGGAEPARVVGRGAQVGDGVVGAAGEAAPA